MKSVKLTAELKRQISISMRSTYELKLYAQNGYKNQSDLAEAIQNEYKFVMGRLWMQVYGDKLASILDRMPEWSISNSTFGVQAGREVFKTNLKRRPGKSTGLDLVLDDDKDFDTYYALKKLSASIEEEAKKFRQECFGVLESISTTKKLLEVWPEAEDHLPDWVKNPEVSALPVLSLIAINEKLAGK